jgi:HPt (histidine-containing phosphotransfer) domain-containing protein
MPPSEDDFQARLLALNERFSASLPGTLDKLAAARTRLDPGAPAIDVASELHVLLHSIAGSAATFGYPELGRAARAVENGLRALLADHTGTPGWAAWCAQCDRFLAWARHDPQAPYT